MRAAELGLERRGSAETAGVREFCLLTRVIVEVVFKRTVLLKLQSLHLQKLVAGMETLEKEMATHVISNHSVFLLLENDGQRSLVGYCLGPQRVRHD